MYIPRYCTSTSKYPLHPVRQAVDLLYTYTALSPHAHAQPQPQPQPHTPPTARGRKAQARTPPPPPPTLPTARSDPTHSHTESSLRTTYVPSLL
ncbi:uncharacterized protein K452DRAFT_39953 [Aplosporella prunicola CBS 121167]|uniref:Uncharacterized protein n=1 Tax=Aplosporella prunicola CBS 121167 TaxID=1176127 RepID=A0A6A6BB95_9PEZI|nr:uncharacterized protein K452DRAFT_39953 [Aplosporella prunicola CBS 121167]KAF2141479.1 hypothetical protein K452DRAFT_39953 [Aplosporella prunicola CBS 121167]